MIMFRSVIIALAFAASSCAADAPPVTVGCLGDSITAGIGASNVSTTAYPAVLQAQLGADFIVYNFGHSAATMQRNVSEGPPYWDTAEFAMATALSPDVVVLMLGTNDAKADNWQGADAFLDALGDMTETLAALPSAPAVLVAAPPPLYNANVYTMSADVINGLFPVKVPPTAHAHGAAALPLDVFSALGGANLSFPEYYWDKDPPWNQTSCKCDGCHPDDLGYVAMATAVAVAVRDAAVGVRARRPSRPARAGDDEREAAAVPWLASSFHVPQIDFER